MKWEAVDAKFAGRQLKTCSEGYTHIYVHREAKSAIAVNQQMPVSSQNWRLYAGAALIVWAAGLQVHSVIFLGNSII